MAAACEYEEEEVTGTLQFLFSRFLTNFAFFRGGTLPACTFPPTALRILKHEIVDTFDSVLDADLTFSLSLPYDFSISLPPLRYARCGGGLRS